MKFIEVMGYTPGAVLKRRLFISVDKIKMVCSNKYEKVPAPAGRQLGQEETLIYFGHNDFIVVGESVEQVMEKINGNNI